MSLPESKLTNDNIQRSVDSKGTNPVTAYLPVEVYATNGTPGPSHGAAGDICVDLKNGAIKYKGLDGAWH